ncbi:MAG TPA: hypothetical protein VHH53_14580, partial [Pseudonocardiaceae bacterium]|nr:hypothetical protein [Pseudonocardiaceae bacterium]
CTPPVLFAPARAPVLLSITTSGLVCLTHGPHSRHPTCHNTSSTVPTTVRGLPSPGASAYA